jgi:hypothetical protein
MFKNAFRLRELFCCWNGSLLFIQKVCRRCLRKPGHCKGIVFITSEGSQNMEGKFHSFSFLLEIAEFVGMQCTDTTFRDSFLLSTAIYLSRGFVSQDSNVKETKIVHVKIINSYVLCLLCVWIADYAKIAAFWYFLCLPTCLPACLPTWLIFEISSHVQLRVPHSITKFLS